MTNPFIVSVHIPKTAGTSLAAILDRCFDRRVIYDYAGYDTPQVVSDEFRQHASFIQSYFRVLHGHFFAEKYVDVFPGAAFIATLRHPVYRVISQFQHEMNDSGSKSWYHEYIVSGRMDVVQFAEQDGIGNAMTRHLAGVELRDYAVLLISERMIESCRLLARVVGHIRLGEHFGNPPKLPLLNRADERKTRIDVTEDVKRAIYARTTLDNEIYAEALRLFERQSQCLL
ncbi:MAG: sulfotransferase [Acetobacteraceae bacterium]|nr:sulfotransferase family 2 domain-containing protein [Pseudomonadota bacterium]